VIRIGALGDSVTDEYRFYPPHRTRAANWVELLASTRRVSFGPFGLAGRGEPRNGGFAYNWARSDATSAEMVRDQLPGLAAQAARGRIDYAGILIGGNDFIGVLKSPDPATALAEAGPRVARDILTAVTTLLAASPDVRVVVATLPDITLAPEFSELAGIGLLPPPLIDALSGAIGRVNDLIRATAAGNDRVAVAELAALANTAPIPLIPFGGTLIDTRTPGDGFRHFVLADGRHPGVVGQGIIADLFVQAVDLEFGAGIAPLPPRQIVRLARAIQGRGR
jgi:lysophospholipase L1-like esterase